MQINVESNKNMNKIVKILKPYTYNTNFICNNNYIRTQYIYIYIYTYIVFTKARSEIYIIYIVTYLNIIVHLR